MDMVALIFVGDDARNLDAMKITTWLRINKEAAPYPATVDDAWKAVRQTPAAAAQPPLTAVAAGR